MFGFMCIQIDRPVVAKLTRPAHVTHVRQSPARFGLPESCCRIDKGPTEARLPMSSVGQLSRRFEVLHERTGGKWQLATAAIHYAYHRMCPGIL